MTPVELAEAKSIYDRLQVLQTKVAQTATEWRVVYKTDDGKFPEYLRMTQAQVNSIIKPLIQQQINTITARLTQLGVTLP
jgi:hypothetical protein